LNSVFAQYEELSSPQFAVINLSLRLRLITADFGLDNSSYCAQPHSIIVKYCIVFRCSALTKWIQLSRTNHKIMYIYKGDANVTRCIMEISGYLKVCSWLALIYKIYTYFYLQNPSEFNLVVRDLVYFWGRSPFAAL
jgi:hypothetical protein